MTELPPSLPNCRCVLMFEPRGWSGVCHCGLRLGPYATSEALDRALTGHQLRAHVCGHGLQRAAAAPYELADTPPAAPPAAARRRPARGAGAGPGRR